MSYRVQLSRRASRAVVDWGLPDEVVTEVHLRLHRDRLGTNPAAQLTASPHPGEGLLYIFSQVDPHNRFREYTQDEETLWVIEAACLRSDC
jgi:hypothetical protein